MGSFSHAERDSSSVIWWIRPRQRSSEMMSCMIVPGIPRYRNCYSCEVPVHGPACYDGSLMDAARGGKPNPRLLRVVLVSIRRDEVESHLYNAASGCVADRHGKHRVARRERIAGAAAST